MPRLVEVLVGVGSNLKAFECPWCGCHDRERHVFMYMTAAGFLPDLSGKRVLHFAPEKRLTGKILAASPDIYIQCDIDPQAVDVMKVDMLNIPFDEASFTLLIANHVMEHVSDDAQALREIHRVLKPGGFAILQTPFSARLDNTWEDAGIDSDEARLEAYGQEDHVRLYGRDIFERFTAVGFESCVGTHDDLLPGYDAMKYGINEREPFFLFKRPD
jgi:predicted SAM-dependent methyltransferase